jgi:lysophospholipase L1-like esterase
MRPAAALLAALVASVRLAGLAAGLGALAATGALAAPLAAPLAAQAPRACPHAMPAWLPGNALPLDMTRAALAERPVLKIVAIGSSSTEGIGASDPSRTYPALLEAALTRALPGVRVRVFNRGVSGEDAAQNLARLDADVLTLRPALVIWQAGANMAMRLGDPERFRLLLTRGITLLQGEGIDVILMDTQVSPRTMAAPRTPAFLAMTRETAKAHNVALFPRHALMQQWRAGDPAAQDGLIGPDALHHTDAGYACLAEGLATMIMAGLR